MKQMICHGWTVKKIGMVAASVRMLIVLTLNMDNHTENEGCEVEPTGKVTRNLICFVYFLCEINNRILALDSGEYTVP